MIRILGPDSKSNRYVIALLNEVFDKANLNIPIEQITNSREYLKYNLDSVPAIQYNDNKPVSLRENNSFNQNLRSFITQVLRDNDYGSLTQLFLKVDNLTSDANIIHYAHRFATQFDLLLQIGVCCEEVETKVKKLLGYDWRGNVLSSALVNTVINSNCVHNCIYITNDIKDIAQHENALFYPPQLEYRSFENIVVLEENTGSTYADYKVIALEDIHSLSKADLLVISPSDVALLNKSFNLPVLVLGDDAVLTLKSIILKKTVLK